MQNDLSLKLNTSVDYVKNKTFCVDETMNNAIISLFLEHRPERILSSCNAAITEMKNFLHSSKSSSAWIPEIDKAENCFLQVFFSHWKNVSILSSVVQALSLLMTLNTSVKYSVADKGMLLYINKLIEHEWKNADKKEVLKSGYSLAIATTENSPKSLKIFFETNFCVIQSLKLNLSVPEFGHDGDIIDLCLRQISILIFKNESDDEEILRHKEYWCNNFFNTTIDGQPLVKRILDSMNRFLKDSEDLQLHGLKCLNSFSVFEGFADQILEFGGLDTTCFALSLYIDNQHIFMESFTLISKTLTLIEPEGISHKEPILLEVISLAIQRSSKISKQLCVLCDCLLALLLMGSNLGKHLVKNNIPLLLFQALKNLQNDSLPALAKCYENARVKLSQCIYVIMAKPDDDISFHHSSIFITCLFLDIITLDFHVLFGTNPVLFSARTKLEQLVWEFNMPTVTLRHLLRNNILCYACEKGEVDLALLAIFLGANINDTHARKKPLELACQNQDEVMVKHLLILVATFNHIRVLPCRIDDILPSLSISLQKQDDQITAALLWYLLNRDVNGVAEWSKCKLTKIKSEWLEMAFTSQISHENREKYDNVCLETIRQFNAYKLGSTILQSVSNLQADESNESELKHFIDSRLEQFQTVFEEKRCPLQQVLSSVENAMNSDKSPSCNSDRSVSSDGDHFELMDMYRCPRCSGYVAYREFLKFSFDDEALLEDDIHGNPIEVCTCPVVFPPSHVSAADLKEIQLSRNGLLSLDSFCFLSRTTKARLSATVKRIYLLANSLTEIPSSFIQIFTNLINLDLSQNQLLFFPFDVLRYCTHLEALNLSENMLQSGTSFLSESGNMDPHRIRGGSLPEHFQHGLKTLKINCNAYCNFPTWIFEIFTQLEHLDIRKNAISNFVTKDLLKEMVEHSEKMCSCLKYLNLSENNIQTFCTYLLHFAPNLKHLDLSKNKLSEIEECSEEILANSKLSFVDLSGNQLTEFPKLVNFLPRLKVLLLNNNNISDTSDIRMNWKSRFLQHMDLSSNELTDVNGLASVLVDNWPSTLKVLSLSHNALAKLPPILGKLSALEVLDISDNDLYELPDELGDLSNLKSFIVRENELDLEEAILKGTAQEIRQFLYARLKKSVPQNRVKLILIGNPNAGKTTLLNSLRSRRARTFSRDMNNKKTPPTVATIGVNVVKVDMKHNKRLLELSVWDFAGQEDFYATHPCFISEHAMYIALYDASKGPEQLETLKPWLTAIHARATHCPVLIIGTHADKLSWTKQRETIQLKQRLEDMSQESWFPRGVIRSGILNPKVFDVREYSQHISQVRTLILEAIEDAKIQERPLVGNMVPHSYVQLAKLLEQKADQIPDFPVITFKELVELIETAEAEQSPAFDSCSELMLAVKYLHQTGFLLHFDDPRSRLQDYFFIRPAWLCKLLAQVVTLSEDSMSLIRYIDKHGILSKAKFVEHFSSAKLDGCPIPRDFFPQLFRILENFEVLLSQGIDRCLVPSKLPLVKPSIVLPVREVDEKLIRYFSLSYTPMGLWPRLLARLLAFGSKLLSGFTANNPDYTFASPQKWREGVYFKWEKTGLSPDPFVLVQSGSEEYDKARRYTSTSSSVYYSSKVGAVIKNESLERKKRERGIEIIVPRNQAGVILLARLVDHITHLVEEWYPGLLKSDLKGRSMFQQYAPCVMCYCDRKSNVHCFCINDLAESIVCNGTMPSSTCIETYKTRIGSSGVLLVYCRNNNHKDTPIPLTFLAPEINLDDYEQSLRLDPKLLSFEAMSKNILGEGGFGVVYQATYDGEDVAVKTFSKDATEMAYTKLRVELNVLAQHQHPSVVAFKGFIPPASSTPNLPLPLLAMEFAKLGSLGKLLSKMSKLSGQQRKSALSRHIRHRIAYEVAEGLCFLHQQNIVYRDLKPDNILLMSLDSSSPTVATITDYGISIHASPSGTSGPTGSPGYSAPEVASLRTGGKGRRDLYPYSLKCDVYSYGLVLHELAVGSSPWVEYVKEEHRSGLASGNKTDNPDEIVLKGITPSPITTYEGASAWPYAQELVTDCLKRNPEERPTSCQIVSLLANVQSSCFSCHNGDVTSVPTNQNASVVNFFYSTQLEHENEKRCNIVNVLVDIEKGRAMDDDDWLSLESGFTISCMLQAPSLVNKKLVEGKQLPLRAFSHKCATNSSPVVVAGTTEGHLLIIQSRNKTVKNQFSSAVKSIHFHRSSNKKSATGMTDGFVVIGLEDCSLVGYTLDKITDQYNKQPTFTKELAEDIGGSGPVNAMASIDSTLYAVCGNKIVFLSLADSGGPTVQKVIEAIDPIQSFTSGNNHFYASYEDRDKVQVWQKKGFSQKVIDVTKNLMQCSQNIRSFDLNVSALYLNTSQSALWVGTSAGHVLVYSESKYELLAVLQRHSGPIQQFFALADINSDNDLIGCLGKGFRPVSGDIDRSEEAPFSPTLTPRVDHSSFYLTLWDADLPKQASALTTVLKARKTLKTAKMPRS